MRDAIAFPLLGLALILQSAVVSQVKLISGHADLILVTLAAWALQPRVRSAWHWAAAACFLLAFVSRMPWLLTGAGYAGVVLLAQALQKRMWQAPLLMMFAATFAGTLLIHALSYGYLFAAGVSLPLEDAAWLVTLPSLLLNMLFSIPVYALMRDVSRWVYPEEVTE